MEQDKRILRAEDIPVMREEDSPKEQIRQLLDYIYKLHEQLRYILSNLTEENFNKEALKVLLAKAAAGGEESE